MRAETGTDYLLSGSLRRSGTRFRVNAELVDTRSGAPVWSSRYEDEWGDVFVLEDKPYGAHRHRHPLGHERL